MTGRTSSNLKLDQEVEAVGEDAGRQETAGQLALEVLHEIRNPLDALGHLTFLAFQEAEDVGKVREYMRLAFEQMDTLSRIAGHTLGFARFSKFPKSTELVDLTEAAVRIHQRRMDTRSIHLVRKLPSELSAEVHRGEILQVLSNLISNALDALPDHGTMSLKLWKSGSKVHFIVADNGSGIAPEHRHRIFQPFYTTKGESGTGLGLALSKKIVEGHRGVIRIRSSVRPGSSGTVFRVTLPV